MEGWTVSLEVSKDNTEEYLKALQDAIDAGLEMIGLTAENYAKKACPVDTGRLRNSITHTQSGDNSEIIGTNVEYAPFVELGTSRQAAQPYLKPAATDHTSTYRKIFEQALQNA